MTLRHKLPPMENMSRKEREFLQREQLIIDTAKHILGQEGFHSLTMERIAAEIEYSRGTVYKHFNSKEEVVTAIGRYCMDNLLDMFRRAADYPGNLRARITAVGVAHSIYAQLHPVEMQNMQIIKSQAIREKVSSDIEMEILQREQQITQLVSDIVKQAMDKGDIVNPHPCLPDALVFGLWTMGYGSNLLHLSGIPFEKIGMCQPLDIMWLNAHKLLDSYNWQPLSNSFDMDALHQDILQQCFAEEIKQLGASE